MKIVKRLIMALMFLITLPLAPVEAIYYSIRWIFTGKEFASVPPMCIRILLYLDN